MIAAAREKVEGTATRILAVTILTGFSDAELRSDLGLHETATEFLEYARRSEDSNEFDALIGLAGAAEKTPESGGLHAEGDSRLPE